MFIWYMYDFKTVNESCNKSSAFDFEDVQDKPLSVFRMHAFVYLALIENADSFIVLPEKFQGSIYSCCRIRLSVPPSVCPSECTFNPNHISHNYSIR